MPAVPEYHFAALRGTQAGRSYYVVMCPLSIIPRLLLFDEPEVPADCRAQRTLDHNRIPTMVRYMVENTDNYVFSSITASIDGCVSFDSVAPDQPDIGRLVIPMTARFVINDGQHRRAAIVEAIKQKPELRDETISVVLYPDSELKRSQQLFADLNKNVVRPTTSLGILYDHRDDLSSLTRHLIKVVPVFQGRIELERSSLSYTSRHLFTLSAIHQSTAKFLGKSGRAVITADDRIRATRFWTEVGTNMPAWLAVLTEKQHPGELRRHQIQTHGLVLHALARLGAALMAAHPDDWSKRLSPLKSIDWRRQNPVWEGRALLAGRISKSHVNIVLTTNVLKKKLGLVLDDAERKLEQQHAAVHQSAPAA